MASNRAAYLRSAPVLRMPLAQRRQAGQRSHSSRPILRWKATQNRTDPLNGLAGAVDGDDSDTDKDDPGDEPTNNNHCQFSASDRFRRVHFTPIVETEPDAEPAAPIRQNG